MRFLPRITAALAAAALLPIVAAAQQPQPPQGPPPQGRAGGRGMAQPRQMTPRPQLTEQQRDQIRTFDEQHRQTLEGTRNELGDLNRQLNEQLTAAQPDNSKVNSLRSAIVQKESALAQARLDRLAKMSSILTAEQRQALGGRGLGEIFGPGGGRGGVMAGPRGGGAGRGGEMLQRRQQVERQLQQQRGLRGRGGAVAGPRGGGGGRGGQMLQRGRGGRGAGGGAVLRERADDARLRAEIRRLEAQLEALRRRIR